MLSAKSVLAFCAVVLMLTFVSCSTGQDSDRIYIAGTVAHKNSDRLVLFEVDTLKSYRVDSVRPDKKGDFSFSIRSDKAGFYFLKSDHHTSALFPAFPGDSVEVIMSNSRQVQIIGGIEAGDFWAFSELLAKSKSKMDSLSGILLDSRHKPEFAGIKSTTDSLFQEISNDLRNKAVFFMENHPAFLSNLLIINASLDRMPLFDESIDYPLLFKTDSLLKLYHKNNPHAIYFNSRANRLRKRIETENQASQNLSQGSFVPEIKLPGTSGKEISLSQQSGKYRLIYFWAAADARSRKSNQELKILYEKYRESGFSVYAVSFDPFSDRFAGAVNLDKLWWTNVNDTLGMNSPLLSEYRISEFPAFVLIDEEGKIIDRFISVKALSAWLQNKIPPQTGK